MYIIVQETDALKQVFLKFPAICHNGENVGSCIRAFKIIAF